MRILREREGGRERERDLEMREGFGWVEDQAREMYLKGRKEEREKEKNYYNKQEYSKCETSRIIVMSPLSIIARASHLPFKAPSVLLLHPLIPLDYGLTEKVIKQ